MRSSVITATVGFILLMVATASGQEGRRVYIVSHGWHTGLVLPVEHLEPELLHALKAFEFWSHVEIGWGDEGFYRGGKAIPLGVALKAVATPTPTVLHVSGGTPPIEEFFSDSEIIAIDLDPESFVSLCQFVAATFEIDAGGSSIDIGTGIYGTSKFFRARGSYYFPNTCNVWTLRSLHAAGLSVVPVAGIRAENVIAQAAKHGKSIRRYPGRSRLAVLMAVIAASVVALVLRSKNRLTLMAWGALLVGTVTIAGLTMARINQMAVPAWLFGAATWSCWASVALVAVAHGIAIRKKFRWRHVIGLLIATVAVGAGLSPL